MERSDSTCGAYRLSFRFSPDGTRAACLTGDGALTPELWSFGADGAQARRLPTAAGETTATQPVPTPDGRVLLVRTGGGREHEVAVVGAGDGDGTRERFVAAFGCRGLRALPSPDPATAAWLIAYHGDGRPGEGRAVLHRVD